MNIRKMKTLYIFSKHKVSFIFSNEVKNRKSQILIDIIPKKRFEKLKKNLCIDMCFFFVSNYANIKITRN